MIDVEGIATGNVNSSFIDEYLGNYKQESSLFSITLPKGESFTFRNISDASEWQAIKEKAAEFTKVVMESGHGFPADIIPESGIVVAACSIISNLSVEPKLSEKDMFVIAKRFGNIYEILLTTINAKTSLKIDVKEVDEVKRLGEDLDATIGTM